MSYNHAVTSKKSVIFFCLFVSPHGLHGILAPDQELNPGPTTVKRRV